MLSTPSYKITLFDNCELVVPAGLTCHLDGTPGQRVVFLSDEEESFVISFEEGMKPMDMFSEKPAYQGAHSAELYRNGKHIDLRRYANHKAGFAFFRIDWSNEEGERLCISGQMVAELSYQWTDEIEPVLLDIMDGLRIPAVGDACKKKNGCDT